MEHERSDFNEIHTRTLKNQLCLCSWAWLCQIRQYGGRGKRHYAAIEQVAQRWIELYTAGDLDRLMTLYTDDAIVALHGRPALRGVEQIRNFFAPGMGKSRVTFEIDIEEIQIHGDTAHLLSKYYLTSRTQVGRRYLPGRREIPAHIQKKRRQRMETVPGYRPGHA